MTIEFKRIQSVAKARITAAEFSTDTNQIDATFSLDGNDLLLMTQIITLTRTTQILISQTQKQPIYGKGLVNIESYNFVPDNCNYLGKHNRSIIMFDLTNLNDLVNPNLSTTAAKSYKTKAKKMLYLYGYILTLVCSFCGCFERIKFRPQRSTHCFS